MADKPTESKIPGILKENGPGELTPETKAKLDQASLEEGREPLQSDYLRQLAETLKSPKP